MAVRFVGLVLILTFSGCSQTSEASPSVALAIDTNATVVRVVDGDTIIAKIGSAEESVRLIGFDTPESVDPGTEVECFGPEASKHLASILPAGTPIRIERDAESRDRYDRLLGYVYRGSDATFVNLAMVEAGFAETLSIEPNTLYKGDFADAELRAKRDQLAMWGNCPPPR